MTETAPIVAAPGMPAYDPDAILISTRELLSAEGRNTWAEALDRNFCEMGTRWMSPADRFDGTLAGRCFGEITVTVVTADPHETIRTPLMISADPDGQDFFVTVLTHGCGEVSQDRRLARMASGGFAVVDGARPFHFRFDAPFQQIVVRIPRAALTARLSEPLSEQVTATTVSAQSGTGLLVSAMLQQLAAVSGSVTPRDSTPLSMSALDMLATALLGLPRDGSRSGLARATDLRRAQDLMLARLHDHELTLGQVSQALSISPRYLSQIFAEDGRTPQKWLIAQRIERAKRLLVMTNGSLSDIANHVGFKDVAHFSRSFREHAGDTPGRYRTQRQSGR